MKINSSDLINLPVFTEDGQNLGRLDSFDVNIASQEIEKYFIKTGLIKGLWHERLMIDKSQVISITKNKMVVEDNTIKDSPALGTAKPVLS